MWALIAKGFAWVFGGGFKDVSALVSQIANLFRKSVAQQREENEKSAQDELKQVEQGGRPRWED